ncbi:MAG: sulfotransferase [Methylomonas sp.]|nr:sulfotransferase [Methylomonas sp.]
MVVNPFPSTTPGRNTLCPCGSGKKVKACCGASGAMPHSVLPDDSAQRHREAYDAVKRGDHAEAERCFRELLAGKPNDAAFMAGLGQALCWLKRRKEGVAHLLRAAKAVQRQTEKHCAPAFAVDLSAQLLHWGEADAAERLARVAVRVAPDSAVALNNLALCLSRVNRHREALPLARRVCALLPQHPGCSILLATLEARAGERDAALARLAQVIERNDEPLQTARAWLESSVILDTLARYDDAFAAMTRAGALHSAAYDFPPDRRDYFFDNLARNRDGFDAVLLNRWSAEDLASDGLPSPIFLLGFLRSGTTLTEQVIAAHPRLMATDESSIVFEMGQQLVAMTGIHDHQADAVRRLNQAQVQALRRFYWQRMALEFGDQVMRRPLIDKHALNTIDLGLIAVVFPAAKILFAVRDPRDICISCFMQPFAPSPATINLLSWQGIAQQYAAVMDYWLHLRPLMQPSYLELRYEDSVGDFETCYRRVFEFLGVEWVDEVTRFHEKVQGRYVSTPSFAQVSQPLYRSAVARWRHYPGQVEEIMPCLQRFVAAFGYD